ncbi:UvrD-helicase domain-containing protein [Curtobacterium flaccumfaciens]|uniref:3'-5' exonuclease n=1 Tax=Curtobacterium flaccumfaciens TaxID=2035 RepID=UPI0021CA3556|nr:3'-5' exonuclease [Curtobacterium flaccumfaciens]UXN24515.1 UvrD-helicase domain-containing protein [Curtobacterium flaccumfaciens]
MPLLVMANMQQKLEKVVQLKLFAFMAKLQADDTLPGLHIEPMVNAADARARTGRVDQGLRAVLYKIEVPSGPTTYVCAGVYEHDEAIKIAKSQVLRVNPVNGVTELIAAPAPAAPASQSARWVPEPPTSQKPFLDQFGYTVDDLTSSLGFDLETAERLLGFAADDELLAFAEALPNQWQQNAALGLAVGDSIEGIKTSLGLGGDEPEATVQSADEHPADVAPSATASEAEASQLLESLKRPASQMQFTFVDDDEELRRVIEGGDFGAWRVFLHPEQRAYATRAYKGPFRLTGGAGTGKTVVLLHRARELAGDANARIVLTTFTRTLAGMLDRDLRRLDPQLPRAAQLGESGILTAGIDQLAHAVRDAADPAGWEQASIDAIGWDAERSTSLVSNGTGWDEAVFDAKPDLPGELRSPAFLESEYLQVVLPSGVITRADYFAARRPGRGVALDRAKRAQVWTVVEQFRRNARAYRRLSWAELSSVAAAYLDAHPEERPADYVLVDEAQDLSPSHWTMLRALVGEHGNDLFVAEDSHQRIYGQRVVLSRLGIKIVGRSRRLTLNYRTTQQNLRYALGVLEGGDFTDSEGSPQDEEGYRSARLGPEVRVRGHQTPSAQYDALAQQLEDWRAQSSDVESMAVLVRTKSATETVVQQLAARNVPATEKTARDKVRVMTMHSAKGLEFSRVVLFDVSAGVVPNKLALQHAAPEERADAELRERSLLYVAASRARDELVVSWQGAASPLLSQRVLDRFN